MHRPSRSVRVAAVWFALGLALILTTSAIAAGPVITTRVLDAVTREPLPDAVLASGARTVTTGSDGRAELAPPSDSAVVTVWRIGYRGEKFRAAEVPPEIVLQRAPVLLNSMEVTATGTRGTDIGRGSLLGLASVPRSVLSTRGAPALAEALEAAEGISTSRPGSWGTKAYVRGMGGERVAVLLDGNRLNRACNVGMDGGLATINPDIVERVEILSGPGSTLYGSGNVGGVINVVTRAPRAGSPLQGEIRAAASSAVPGGKAGATLWGGRDRLAIVASLDAASYGDQRSPGGTIDASSFRDATADLAASYDAGRGQLLGAQLQRYSGRDIGYPGAGSAFVPEEDRLLLGSITAGRPAGDSWTASTQNSSYSRSTIT
ncbi:MAG: TonB-dependent receptor plug domain-containing protein [Candidatus Eisenbacteria bacterium]